MPPRQEFRFRRFARKASNVIASSRGFALGGMVIAAWLLCGPFFHFSITWQDAIMIVLSIATFLLVFLVQTSQNRDSAAINIKLNELLRAVEKARDDLVTIETLPDEELQKLQHEFEDFHHLQQARNKVKELESELARKRADGTDSRSRLRSKKLSLHRRNSNKKQPAHT